MKLLRISDFISRIFLRKYQRNLVPYFKKYQLTELEGDKAWELSTARITESVLGSSASQLLDHDEEAEKMRNRKLMLTETVKECFG